ncbi:glutamic acid-rich protein-like [Erpetoichthys calabaricus]|uniref:glutamic acid-rich protein-like n=1 Tax=Erpetoichthys calabaricus TaxID=27687 RepID=UPI002233F649|nr:glutamic acid-rich protein-like [Erpetoichthys calabaricus]
MTTFFETPSALSIIGRLQIAELQIQWRDISERERKARIRNQDLLCHFEKLEESLERLSARTAAILKLRVEHERQMERLFPGWQKKVEKNWTSAQSNIQPHTEDINTKQKQFTNTTVYQDFLSAIRGRDWHPYVKEENFLEPSWSPNILTKMNPLQSGRHKLRSSSPRQTSCKDNESRDSVAAGLSSMECRPSDTLQNCVSQYNINKYRSFTRDWDNTYKDTGREMSSQLPFCEHVSQSGFFFDDNSIDYCNEMLHKHSQANMLGDSKVSNAGCISNISRRNGQQKEGHSSRKSIRKTSLQEEQHLKQHICDRDQERKSETGINENYPLLSSKTNKTEAKPVKLSQSDQSEHSLGLSDTPSSYSSRIKKTKFIKTEKKRGCQGNEDETMVYPTVHNGTQNDSGVDDVSPSVKRADEIHGKSRVKQKTAKEESAKTDENGVQLVSGIEASAKHAMARLVKTDSLEKGNSLANVLKEKETSMGESEEDLSRRQCSTSIEDGESSQAEQQDESSESTTTTADNLQNSKQCCTVEESYTYLIPKENEQKDERQGEIMEEEHTEDSNLLSHKSPELLKQQGSAEAFGKPRYELRNFSKDEIMLASEESESSRSRHCHQALHLVEEAELEKNIQGQKTNKLVADQKGDGNGTSEEEKSLSEKEEPQTSNSQQEEEESDKEEYESGEGNEEDSEPEEFEEDDEREQMEEDESENEDEEEEEEEEEGGGCGQENNRKNNGDKEDDQSEQSKNTDSEDEIVIQPQTRQGVTKSYEEADKRSLLGHNKGEAQVYHENEISTEGEMIEDDSSVDDDERNTEEEDDGDDDIEAILAPREYVDHR